MFFEIIFVVLAVGLMAFAWWWLKRRRRELLGDSEPSGDAGWPAEQQALTRDALVNRSREFDPSAWEDGPDPAPAGERPASSRPAPVRHQAARPAQARPAEDEDEAPAYFDREFLERQRQQRAIDTKTDADD